MDISADLTNRFINFLLAFGSLLLAFKSSPVMTRNRMKSEKVEVFKAIKEMKGSPDAYKQNELLLESLFHLISHHTLKAEYIFRAMNSSIRMDILNRYKSYKRLCTTTYDNYISISYEKVQNLYIGYFFTFIIYMVNAFILLLVVFEAFDLLKFLGLTDNVFNRYYKIPNYLVGVLSLWLLSIIQTAILKRIERSFDQIKQIELIIGYVEEPSSNDINPDRSFGRDFHRATRKQLSKVKTGMLLTKKRHKWKITFSLLFLIISILVWKPMYFYLNYLAS